MQALQQLGAWVRRHWGKTLIGITGSVGKTTTKDIAGHLLAGRFKVFRNDRNFNNHFGLPLSLLQLEWEHQVAVMELGMSAPGEIARLSCIARPDLGVVTNVKPVHLEFFSSLGGIARAKRELIEHLPVRGVAFLNNDDAGCASSVVTSRVRLSPSALRGRRATTWTGFVAGGWAGCEFRVRHRGRSYRLTSPCWVLTMSRTACPELLWPIAWG